MITEPGKEITWGEARVGARQVFEEAGFEEVSLPPAGVLSCGSTSNRRSSAHVSSFSRRSSVASSAFMPPYWLRQRLYVCSLICQL
jgi:hypothetical protein